MSDSPKECEPAAKKLKIEGSESIEPSKNQVDNLGDKYENFVTPEELEKLKEFQVLDEVKSNDEDSNDDDYSSDGKSEDLPEEEIEKMLEEDLPEGFKGAPKPKEKTYVTRQKIVLEEKGVNHFEVLPLDWMMVRHYSGMPVYVHRTSRVCTLAKPYFLGKGNTRRHDIPISAIPCLAYRRALEEEQKQKEIDEKIEEQIKSGTWTNNRPAEKETPNTSSLSSIVIHKRPNECDKNEIATSKCPFRFNTNVNDLNVESENKHCDKQDLPEKNTQSTKGEDIASVKNENKSNVTVAVDVVNMYNVGKKMDSEMTDLSVKSTPSDEAAEENVTSQMETDEISINLETKYDSSNENSMKLDQCNKDKTNDDETGTKHIEAEENDTKDDNTAVTDQPMTVEETPEGSGNIQETNASREEVEIPHNRQPVVLPGGIVMPPPRVETVSTSWKTQHLTHEQVNDYCKRLFKFKTALGGPAALHEGAQDAAVPHAARGHQAHHHPRAAPRRAGERRQELEARLGAEHERAQLPVRVPRVRAPRAAEAARLRVRAARERGDSVPGDGVHRRHGVRRRPRLQQAPGQVGRRARLHTHTDTRDARRARPRDAGARLLLLRLRGHRGPAHHGVLRGHVRAVAARHPAHLPLAQLRRQRQAHTQRDEEAGVPEDRADDEGGQAQRHGRLQEQEDRQAACLASHTAGPAPGRAVVGLAAAAVRLALRQELQGAQAGGTADHAAAGPGAPPRAQPRRAGQAEARDAEAAGEGRGGGPYRHSSTTRRSADTLRGQPEQRRSVTRRRTDRRGGEYGSSPYERCSFRSHMMAQ